jgi:AraC family transcriptional regulator
MNVPVAWGSRAVATLDVGELHFTSISFPAALTLPAHAHDRPTLAVVMRGGFTTTLAGDEHSCAAASLRLEPAGSTHTNRFGTQGAHVVVVQPEASALIGPARDALGRPEHRRDVRAHLLGRAIARELDTPDGVSPLALQGLALELIAIAARSTRAERAAPRWLTQATDLVHDRALESLDLRSVADAVGVTPDALAAAFRAFHGERIGAYARRLRLEWVAGRLRDSTDPIASLAHDAGFADQPHLTRAFRAFSGITPARYRRLSRS